MFIKKLCIRDTQSNVLMREVAFHKGVNFVVDSEASDSHNKVGKTTFLRIIDVLMGAKDRDHLYTDPDTDITNRELYEIIVSRRVQAELYLVDDLDRDDGDETILRAELFPRGKHYINDERVSLDTYWQRLDAILFGIQDNTPTFRQLIYSFVRVLVSGDNNAFLKTLPKGTSNAVYRSIYNFLFDISDPALDKKLGELGTKLSRTKESVKQYKRVNNVAGVEQQRQILAAQQAEYDAIKVRADDIIDARAYQQNREIFADVRGEYAHLSDALDSLDYQITRSRAALTDAEKALERKANLSLSRRFYDEICSMVPDLEKTFQDMVDFNRQLSENKVAYFRQVIDELSPQRDEIATQRDALVADNGRYLALVASNKIDEYEQLNDRLGQLRQEIGRSNQIIDTLTSYESDMSSIQNEIDSYSTGGSAQKGNEGDYASAMASFNRHFKALAKKINDEEPLLVYNPQTGDFPVSISDMSGTSTGTRKSLLAAYDLAYQQFAAEHNMQVPNFVVHDVMESIEGADLRAIVDAANAIDCQYIVAVLKEKLDSSHISQEEQERMQILCLSMDDMVFQGKTVEANVSATLSHADDQEGMKEVKEKDLDTQ